MVTRKHIFLCITLICIVGLGVYGIQKEIFKEDFEASIHKVYEPFLINTYTIGKWTNRASILDSGDIIIPKDAKSFQNNGASLRGQGIENGKATFGNYIVSLQEGSGNMLSYEVTKNGKRLYVSMETAFLADEPFKHFSEEGSNWWLSYSLQSAEKGIQRFILAKNGVELPLIEAFGLSEIDKKVFYFFRTNSGETLSYFYDGIAYTTPFDEIIHDQCCMGAMHNINTSIDGRMVFFAKKGDELTYNTLKQK